MYQAGVPKRLKKMFYLFFPLFFFSFFFHLQFVVSTVAVFVSVMEDLDHIGLTCSLWANRAIARAKRKERERKKGRVCYAFEFN